MLCRRCTFCAPLFPLTFLWCILIGFCSVICSVCLCYCGVCEIYHVHNFLDEIINSWILTVDNMTCDLLSWFRPEVALGGWRDVTIQFPTRFWLAGWHRLVATFGFFCCWTYDFHSYLFTRWTVAFPLLTKSFVLLVFRLTRWIWPFSVCWLEDLYCYVCWADER